MEEERAEAPAAGPIRVGFLSSFFFGHSVGKLTRGVLAPEEADRIAAEVRDEMQAAVDFALGSPYPAADAAVNHVYA